MRKKTTVFYLLYSAFLFWMHLRTLMFKETPPWRLLLQQKKNAADKDMWEADVSYRTRQFALVNLKCLY